MSDELGILVVLVGSVALYVGAYIYFDRQD
jgi:hypothetical protein